MINLAQPLRNYRAGFAAHVFLTIRLGTQIKLSPEYVLGSSQYGLSTITE